MAVSHFSELKVSSAIAMFFKPFFLNQTFEMVIFKVLHAFKITESKNHIFSVWTACKCLCVYYKHIPKKITTVISNLVFYICMIYSGYLKLFMKIGQKICVHWLAKEY